MSFNAKRTIEIIAIGWKVMGNLYRGKPAGTYRLKSEHSEPAERSRTQSRSQVRPQNRAQVRTQTHPQAARPTARPQTAHPQTGAKQPQQKKRRIDFSKRSTKIVITCLALVLLLAAVVFGVVSCVFGKIDFMSEKELAIPEDLDSIVLEPEEETVSESDTIDEEQMEALDEKILGSQVNEDGLRYEEGVTNVLVLGTDGRSEREGHTRSDVIIIMSINDNTKKITLSSIMRDTYVGIPGRRGNDKINAAHAYGGPALAVQTVEKAFGVKIDKFIRVNFYSFMDIVDALGGVQLNISAAEKKVMNVYIRQINRVNHWNEDSGIMTESGENITLTGKQAMGYVRVRYVGDGDYERTLRQRRVLEQIIKKAREADALTLLNVVDKVAENVSTDFSAGEITKLAMNAAEYKDYEISQLRIPVEGSYWGGIYKGIWILDIDFEKNRQALYGEIFDDAANAEAESAE